MSFFRFLAASYTHYITLKVKNLSEQRLLIGKFSISWGKWTLCSNQDAELYYPPDKMVVVEPNSVVCIGASGRSNSWSGTEGE